MVKSKEHVFQVGDLVVFKPDISWVGGINLNDSVNTNRDHRLMIDTNVLGKINAVFTVNDENTQYHDETMYDVLFFSPRKEYFALNDKRHYQFSDVFIKGHIYHYQKLKGEFNGPEGDFSVVVKYENIQPALIC